MTAFVDGKVAKMRASCDACNESKVRCTQAKPVCARCERQGITCVYGLSRRSHKNAPRIQESRPVSDSGSSSAENTNASSTSTVPHEQSDTTSMINSPLGPRSPGIKTTHGSIQAASGTTTAFPKDLATGPDNDFLVPLNPMPQFGMYDQQLLSSNDRGANIVSAHDPMDDTSMVGNDFFSQFLPFSSPDAGGGAVTHDGILSFEISHDQRSSKRQLCSCVSRVIKQLVSMPLVFGDEKASFDSQLSQLRQAINVSEDCINCDCTSRDDLSISMVTLSLLVGHVIQGFESLLTKVSSCSSSLCPNIEDTPNGQTSNVSSPRLSWGVLQIDPDEEDELKQHLWLLQFRKLQRVLMQFNAPIGQPKSPQGSGDPAYVMECQSIHMWLAQRAEIVKDRYEAKNSAREKSKVGILK